MAEFLSTLFHGSKRRREARAEFERLHAESLAARAAASRASRELSLRLLAEGRADLVLVLRAIR